MPLYKKSPNTFLVALFDCDIASDTAVDAGSETINSRKKSMARSGGQNRQTVSVNKWLCSCNQTWLVCSPSKRSLLRIVGSLSRAGSLIGKTSFGRLGLGNWTSICSVLRLLAGLSVTLSAGQRDWVGVTAAWGIVPSWQVDCFAICCNLNKLFWCCSCQHSISFFGSPSAARCIAPSFYCPAEPCNIFARIRRRWIPDNEFGMLEPKTECILEYLPQIRKSRWRQYPENYSLLALSIFSG